MLKKILDMLNKQNELNIMTCGKNWADGICQKTGKPINWDLAIMDECAELLGSMDWKHWKNGKNDHQNQRLEIVDLWHFLMSALLAEDDEMYTFESTANSIEDVINEKVLEPSMDSCILGIANSENSYLVRIQYLFLIMSKIDMTFDQLHSLYEKKRWLNEFRASNGYKDGSYVKEWKLDKHKPAMEDNDILVHFVETLGLDSGKVTFALRYNAMLEEINNEQQ